MAKQDTFVHLRKVFTKHLKQNMEPEYIISTGDSFARLKKKFTKLFESVLERSFPAATTDELMKYFEEHIENKRGDATAEELADWETNLADLAFLQNRKELINQCSGQLKDVLLTDKQLPAASDQDLDRAILVPLLLGMAASERESSCGELYYSIHGAGHVLQGTDQFYTADGLKDMSWVRINALLNTKASFDENGRTISGSLLNLFIKQILNRKLTLDDNGENVLNSINVIVGEQKSPLLYLGFSTDNTPKYTSKKAFNAIKAALKEDGFLVHDYLALYKELASTDSRGIVHVREAFRNFGIKDDTCDEALAGLQDLSTDVTFVEDVCDKLFEGGSLTKDNLQQAVDFIGY